MMKKKFQPLLALMCLMCSGTAWGQTDVTSTYLVNADFEGMYSSWNQPKSDRDIYQPTGWTMSYTNGDSNDMTTLNSSTTQWTNFSSMAQPTNGGNNTYWVRFRWGNGENLTLSQKVTLPAGYYTLSADAFKNTTKATPSISIGGQSVTVSTSGSWNNYSVSYLNLKEQEVEISFTFKQSSADNNIAGFDNFKLYFTQISSIPFDITTILANPSVTSTSGWTNGRTGSGQQYTGAPDNTYLDTWNATLDQKQTISLPAGMYTLKAATRAVATIAKANIYANVTDGSKNAVSIKAVGNTDGELGGGWGWTNVNFVVKQESNVTIGFYSECGGSKWAGADDFHLYYNGPITSFPDNTDLTSWIVNPSFESGSTDGWSVYKANDTGAYPNSNATYTISNADGNYVFNTWGGDAVKYIEQTLTGLPTGVYAVTAMIASDAGTTVTLTDGTSSTSISASSEGKGTGVDGTLTGIAVTDGNLKIRLESTTWYKADNFRLTYLRAGATAEEVKALTERYDAVKSSKMNSTVSSNLSTAYSAFTANNSIVTYKSLMDAVSAAENSVVAYTGISTAISDYQTKANALETSGQTAYDASAIQTKYDNGSYETLAEAEAELNSAYISAVRAQGVGGDFTALLANPDFKTSDLTGWNLNGKSQPAIDVVNHDCEFYEKTFDLSQTVTGLKMGTYEISVQAFQRPGAANDDLIDNYILGQWTSYATLYSSAQTSDVKHICAERKQSRVYTADDWTSDAPVDPTGSKVVEYIPNSMVGGRAWFDAGYFRTTVKAVVTEDEGSMTFGFRGELPSTCWLLFDNFTLKYISKEVLVDEAEAKKLLATVATLLSSKMGTDIKTALQTAYNNLNGDKTNGSYYKALQAAITNAKSSVAAYTTIGSVMGSSNTKASALDSDGQAKYTAEISEIKAKFDNGTIVGDGTNEVSAIKAALIAAVKAQTSDNAVFTLALTNPSFEEGTSGWTNDRNTTGTYDYRTDGINPADSSLLLNVWAWQFNFSNVWQKVTLPAGQYTLSAKARTDAVPLENKTQVRAYVNYVMQSASAGLTYTADATPWNDKSKWIELSTTFSVNEETEVELGIYSNGENIAGNTRGWYQVDDFQLVRNGAPAATMTILEENKWATFYAPFAVDLPANVYSYAITVDGDKAVRAKIGGDAAYTLPASTPVLVYTDNEGGYSESFTAGAAKGTPADEPKDNFLVGTANAISAPASVADATTNYVLQNKSGVVSWFSVKNNTLPANRAYLSVPASVDVKGIFDFTTAVESFNSVVSTQSSETGFNLAGQAVGKDYKGIVILNGKKYLKK